MYPTDIRMLYVSDNKLSVTSFSENLSRSKVFIIASSALELPPANNVNQSNASEVRDFNSEQQGFQDSLLSPLGKKTMFFLTNKTSHKDSWYNYKKMEDDWKRCINVEVKL